jgi:Mg2+/Co2+ transporter CorB
MWLTLLLLALLASALFAGSETGYYGINALRLKRQAAESRNAALLEKTIRQPSAFLATLLIGNNVANDLAVHSAVMLLASTGMGNSELLATILLTPLVFLVGEMWPKQYMLANPNRLLWFSLPLAYTRLVLWPLTAPIAFLVNKLDSGDGDTIMRRNQFVALLHDSQCQAAGEAQVMTAAIRAIESKGQGLAQYLRHDVPQLFGR